MARPRIKDDASRRSMVLSVRVAPGLHQKLARAAAAGEQRVTISQEIEGRLRQSFAVDAGLKKRFGSMFLYQLFRLLAVNIDSIEAQTLGQFPRDHFTYDAVRSCIDLVLDHLRPRRRARVPKHLLVLPIYGRQPARGLGERVALNTLFMLERALRDPDGKETPVMPRVGGGRPGAIAGPFAGKLSKSAEAAWARSEAGVTRALEKDWVRKHGAQRRRMQKELQQKARDDKDWNKKLLAQQEEIERLSDLQAKRRQKK